MDPLPSTPSSRLYFPEHCRPAKITGSSVVHLQAADLWNNNLTRGGDIFVARWSLREVEVVLDDDGGTVVGVVEEGNFGKYDKDNFSTASVAAGFFPPINSATSNTSSSSNTNSEGLIIAEVDQKNADVTDLGGGQYDVMTTKVAGSHWLEVAVVEPGGLWGTYYEYEGVETDGEQAYIL